MSSVAADAVAAGGFFFLFFYILLNAFDGISGNIIIYLVESYAHSFQPFRIYLLRTPQSHTHTCMPNACTEVSVLHMWDVCWGQRARKSDPRARFICAIVSCFA